MAWDRIRGHDEPRRRLQAAFERGRLAHAYLFVGIAGVGKRRFAVELAKALLCERPPAPLTACDRCPACALVDAGTHPDFKTAGKLPDKQELTIEVVRELCMELGQKPLRGSRKVSILDDADDFNEESANVFLKTLEEPPAGAVLILLATSTDRQLPTILSRCQVVRFHPLNAVDMRSILAEHQVTDPTVVARITRLAGGSASLALALNEPAIWDFRQSFLKGLASGRPERVTLAQDWVKYTESVGKDSGDQRDRTSTVILLITDILRAALRISLGGTSNSLDMDDEPHLRQLAETHGPEGIALALEACLTADQYVERRVQLVLLIEQLVDRLCRRVV